MNLIRVSIFIVAITFVLSSSLSAAPLYEITDLGEGLAFDINENGEVLGKLPDGYVCYIWKKDTDTKYFQSPDHFDLTAYRLNDYGEAVGRTYTVQPNGNAFLFLPEPHYGMSEGVQFVGNFEGYYSYGYGINNLGQMVGSTPTDSGIHPFLFDSQSGTTIDLGVLDTYHHGYEEAAAYDINNLGQIVGDSTSKDSYLRAFLYDISIGIMEDLGSPGGQPSDVVGANAINDQGQVVGECAFPPTGTCLIQEAHACFRDIDGTWHDLGVIDGCDARAMDINNQGQIVGESTIVPPQASGNPRHAILWDNTILKDLNDLIPANSGWTLEWASAINEQGQIVGYGTFNDTRHGFLLTPESNTASCPEDLFENGMIDQSDLGVLLANYGQGPGGDIDGDGDTDQQDLGMILAKYGKNC